jgi:CopG family nickel-responsive transcriptional regulator
MKRGRAKKTQPGAEQDLVRFGISIPDDLLKKFDAQLALRKNQNRSEAIRDLIRDKLVQDAWSEGRGEQVATLTLIYDSQNLDVQRRLAENKRALGERLMSTLHVRLGPRQELEVLALRGSATAIRGESEAILALKGILHGKIVMTTPDAP